MWNADRGIRPHKTLKRKGGDEKTELTIFNLQCKASDLDI